MEFRQALYVLKIVSLVFVISFSLDKVLFFTLNKMSDQVFTGQGIGKLNQFLKIRGELDLVVFGSSRANHSINPYRISPDGFNMGVDATKLAYASALIKILPSEKEQTILLHIGSENAFKQDYQGSDLLRLKSKYNRIGSIKNEINKFNQNNWFQNIFWCLSYNNTVLGILKNYVRPNYDYNSYSGYDPLVVNDTQRAMFENILMQEDEAKIDVVDCDRELKLNKIYEQSLLEISQFCGENKKNLIVFTSPVYDDRCKDDNEKLKEILNSRGIIYYDFTDFFKNENSIKYWKDKTHLSNVGAALFTKKIKELVANSEHGND